MIENLKKTTSLLSIKLKIRFIFLIIFIFIGTSFELLSVALLIPILNILVGNIDDIKSFLAEYKLEILINFISIKNILLLFLIIFIVKSLFRLFLVHYQGNFIFSLHKFLVNKLYKHYILKNYLFHTKNNTSKIIRNLTQEIHSCSIGYMGAITNIIIEVLIILSLMSFLLFYQPSVVLVFIMITGAVSLILVKFLNLISKKLGKKRQKFALINLNTIVNGFGGIKDIIVNNKENEIIKKFRANSENLKINNYLFQFLQQVPKIILELIFVISIVILLTYFLQINTPKDEIIVFFGLMIGIFSRVMPSMNKLSSSYVNLSYYKPALDLMHNEIGKISRNNNFKEISKNLNFEKKIELKNITFFYNTKKKYNLKKCKFNNKKR
jgi:ABC-type multidrug transport system fused ATPase/permease subunit